MVASEAKPSLVVAAAIVAFFAIFHGHAHGTELPAGQSGLAYSIGFVVATGCLHAMGIAIGLVHKWPVGQDCAPGRLASSWRSRGLAFSGGRSREQPRARSRAECGASRWPRSTGALLPSPAEAHLVTTGLGPIYDGISHVLVSPDDLVPIVAMSLLAGLNGPTAGRRTLFALTGAWLVGGIAGFLVGSTALPVAATTTSFLVLGGLAAIDRRLSPTVVTALAVAVGLRGEASAPRRAARGLFAPHR